MRGWGGDGLAGAVPLRYVSFWALGRTCLSGVGRYFLGLFVLLSDTGILLWVLHVCLIRSPPFRAMDYSTRGVS